MFEFLLPGRKKGKSQPWIKIGWLRSRAPRFEPPAPDVSAEPFIAHASVTPNIRELGPSAIGVPDKPGALLGWAMAQQDKAVKALERGMDRDYFLGPATAVENQSRPRVVVNDGLVGDKNLWALRGGMPTRRGRGRPRKIKEAGND